MSIEERPSQEITTPADSESLVVQPVQKEIKEIVEVGVAPETVLDRLHLLHEQMKASGQRVGSATVAVDFPTLELLQRYIKRVF